SSSAVGLGRFGGVVAEGSVPSSLPGAVSPVSNWSPAAVVVAPAPLAVSSEELQAVRPRAARVASAATAVFMERLRTDIPKSVGAGRGARLVVVGQSEWLLVQFQCLIQALPGLALSASCLAPPTVDAAPKPHQPREIEIAPQPLR